MSVYLPSKFTNLNDIDEQYAGLHLGRYPLARTPSNELVHQQDQVGYP